MIRPEIRKILENIDKFEKDTNNNEDLFLKYKSIRLIISFYDAIEETHTIINLDIEDKELKGMFNERVYLTGDENRYIYDKLSIADLVELRRKTLMKKSTKLLQSINFEDL